MNPSAWSWTTVLVATLLYWVVAALLWMLRQRRRARGAEPAEMKWLSDTELVVSFEDEIRLLPLAAVALGPPLLLVIFILARAA